AVPLLRGDAAPAAARARVEALTGVDLLPGAQLGAPRVPVEEAERIDGIHRALRVRGLHALSVEERRRVAPLPDLRQDVLEREHHVAERGPAGRAALRGELARGEPALHLVDGVGPERAHR